MVKVHNPKRNGIGHNSNALQDKSPTIAAMDDTFKKAYKKMRVICQIVHNRLEFLRDNLNKARNAESEVDRIEGLLEARGEINFIQTHTEPLQATYHGYVGNSKGELVPIEKAHVDILRAKHGDVVADAEQFIFDSDRADQKAAAMAQRSFERNDFERAFKEKPLGLDD
tara:strand:- start:90 stop:596 length:507 start_codon:yes stop_codon:yes gene_type:complete